MQSLHGTPWADCSHGALGDPCIAAATAPESLYGRPRCVLVCASSQHTLRFELHDLASLLTKRCFGKFDLTAIQLD